MTFAGRLFSTMSRLEILDWRCEEVVGQTQNRYERGRSVGRLILSGPILSGIRVWLCIPGKKKLPLATPFLLLSALATVACSGGCKQCCEWTNDFASALDACCQADCSLRCQPLACFNDRCSAAPRESGSCLAKDCKSQAPSVIKRPLRRLVKCKARHTAKRPEPTIAYEPPRPPKFLLVPTREVLSNVNMMAPTPRRGDVEVGFGPQLDIPGHD